jgi:peptidoglycan hydrolase CwlO-like protein
VPSRASLGRRKWRTASAATVVVVVFSMLASGSVLADTKSELEAAKKRLTQLENEVADAQAQADALQAQADAIAAQVHQTQEAIDETEFRIEQTLVGIRRRESRIEVLQTRLGQRARHAYIGGPGGIFEVILGSSSFGDLSDRLALYDSVQESDADLALSIENERIELEGRKAELDDMKAELVRVRGVQEAQLAAQTEKLGQLMGVLANLDDKRAEAKELVSTLTRKYKNELAAIERARELAGGGGIIHGSGVFQVCPVDAPNSFTNDFGAPRVGHTHQGNDIFAPYGTPIRATFPGVASNASNSLGGLSVYVHGGGGYTYNAHLSAFGKLGSVNTGDIVGYVGNSGNARYTPPHNHFEWHPGGGSAVNPYYYLLDACR